MPCFAQPAVRISLFRAMELKSWLGLVIRCLKRSGTNSGLTAFSGLFLCNKQGTLLAIALEHGHPLLVCSSSAPTMLS